MRRQPQGLCRSLRLETQRGSDKMSLDVYLKAAKPFERPASSGIFIREGGQTKEISREEWDRRNPGQEPVSFLNPEEETDVLYRANITHNLNTMAQAAGVYRELWRPDEIGFIKASDLIKPLSRGLMLLCEDPDTFKAFNPSNGWGDYNLFIRFVSGYLAACIEHPEATIEVSR
jgi:hypothetical protein